MLKDEYEDRAQLDFIRSQPNLTAVQRRSMITNHKQSFNVQKNSSIQTIFSVTNTMVGSSCLVIPLVFQKSGIILSSLICIAIGYVSMETCSLQLIHFKLNEMDLTDAIIRILGYKYYYSFIISSILLMYFGSMIYFLLSANLFYDLISLIALRFDTHLPDKSKIDYQQFSYQYSGMILFMISFIVFLQKDLKIFIKMGSIGIFSICCYILFLITMGCININSNTFKASNLNLFTDQIATTLGVFAISFFIHSIAIPIFKNNRDYSKNTRDLRLGFLLTLLIYLSIGIFGSLAIQKQIDPNINIQTSLDYFKDSIVTIFITLGLFIQITTSLPLVWYITRSQIFNLIYKDDLPSGNKLVVRQIICNIVFLGFCLTMQQINANIQLFISLNGAVCGFWLIYVIPVKLHIRCLYSIQQVVRSSNSLLNSNPNPNDNQDYNNQANQQSLADPYYHTFNTKTESIANLLIDNAKLHGNETKQISNRNICKSMHLSIKKRFSYRSRVFVCTLAVLFGFTILILNVLDPFGVFD